MWIVCAMRRVLVEAEAAERTPPALRRQDYRGRKKPAIDWGSETARHALLQDLVADAATLVAWARQQAGCESLQQAAMLLETVATQDVTRDADGTAQIAEQVAPDRVISVVDPEMRHGRKTSSQRFDGYKAHVTAQVGGGDQPRWITAITVTPGNTPDGEGAVPTLREREALTGTLPATLLGDTAYGGARTRAAVLEAAPTVRLEAPVPPGSARAGQLPKTAFRFDLNQGTVTCPAGVTVSLPAPRAGTPADHRQTVAFPTATCADCRLRAQCVRGTGGRGLVLHPHEAQRQAERARQADPAWQQRYRRRSAIEHVIRGLTRWRDRATHYWGRKKTEMQVLWQAVGYNIGELARVHRLREA